MDLRREVGVMSRKQWRGANNPDDNVDLLEVLPLDQAMERAWTTDAHFITYRQLHGPNTKLPRCNKPVLPQLRALGEDLVTDMLVFDYDLPEHRAWNLGEFDEWLRCFADMAQGEVSWAAHWRYLYSTAHGCRIVYVLDSNIPVDVAEEYSRWIVTELRKHKLTLDTGCSDWTRVFRLPYVVRDGIQTWEQTYCKVLRQPDIILSLSLIGREESRDALIYGNIPRFDIPLPELEEVQEILQNKQIVQAVRRRVKNKAVHSVLFENASLQEGSRNTNLTSLVGQLIGATFRIDGMTPQIIYALFLSTVQQLDPDQGTPDWFYSTWDLILRIWALEASRLDAQRARVQKEMARGEDSLVDIMENMKIWCDHPGLYSHEAMEWTKRHLIANTGNNFYIMRADGYYDSMPTDKNQMVSRVSALGMEGAIQLREPSQAGPGWKKLALMDVLNKHSTPINSLEAVPSIDGGYIKNIDTPGATLIIPSFRRNPNLTPEYNVEVDQWLKYLFGQYYEKGIKWIAWSLAFEKGSICALSLAGPPGSGKKMFAQGLSECLETPSLASVDDMVGDYQYGLKNSPFLVVNEGWPKSHKGMHPADQFRRYVSGELGKVMEKFRHPVTVRNAIRLIFTANNMDLIRMLTSNREMSPDDRHALAERLFHIDYGPQATKYLLGLGGMRHTAKIGAKWINGDGASDSNFVVAKYFLYLYSRRHTMGDVGNRFLVGGEYNADLMFAMQTESGSSPLIIETVINMMSSEASREGLVIRPEEGRAFILAAEILKAHRAKEKGLEKLTMAQIGNTLKSITIPNSDNTKGIVLDERKGQGRKSWHELDLGILHAVARRDGWRCDVIAALLEKAEERV